MTADTEKTPSTNLGRARYQAALGAALVAAVFCLAVGAIMLVFHLRHATVELNKSEELANLRTDLLKAPDAAARAALQEEIRRRDLALRQAYFGREAFMKRGGYLLVGGLAVCLLAAGRVAKYRKRLPMPSRAGARPKPAGVTRRARWSVAGLALVLVGAGAALVALYGNPLTIETPAPTEGAAPLPAGAETYPTPEEIARQWPRFRGPGGLGVSAYTNVPATWNGKTGQNILWKVPVPLPGENSPVVWGDRVFLSGATKKERAVFCFEAAGGKLLWARPVETAAGEAAKPPDILEDTGYAAPTTATDGRRISAIFANGDIACFDYSGKRLWARNLGPFKNSYGYANSLTLYRGTVLVLLDQGEPGKTRSSLLALDLRTGKTVWETKRPVPTSWATPILFHNGRREEFVASAKPWVIAYDPATGTELWRAKVLDGDVAPSPAFGAGMVFAVNTRAKLAAIRTGGAGDVTGTHVVWSAEDNLPDIVSPACNGKIVLIAFNDTLTCYAAADGKKLWVKEMDGAIFKSSPTVVGDTIYIMDEKGVMHILAAGEEFKELGRAELGEPADSSPAFLDGRLYIRGQQNLYCIGKK